jgi:hypothetical protein
LLGALFLALQLVPGLGDLIQLEFSWPLIIIGVGVFLLVFGLLVGAPGMAVPACIVGGIGGILYYQNTTTDWTSWSYLWTLIPGFVGVGSILAGLLGENPRRSIRDGAWLVAISAVLFLVFGSLFGGRDILGPYWPVLIVGLGVLLLLQGLFRRR